MNHSIIKLKQVINPAIHPDIDEVIVSSFMESRDIQNVLSLRVTCKAWYKMANFCNEKFLNVSFTNRFMDCRESFIVKSTAQFLRLHESVNRHNLVAQAGEKGLLMLQFVEKLVNGELGELSFEQVTTIRQFLYKLSSLEDTADQIVTSVPILRAYLNLVIDNRKNRAACHKLAKMVELMQLRCSESVINSLKNGVPQGEKDFSRQRELIKSIVRHKQYSFKPVLRLCSDFLSHVADCLQLLVKAVFTCALVGYCLYLSSTTKIDCF